MAKEISSMPAASRFSNWTSRWDLSTCVHSQEKMNEQPKHGDQKSHRHKFRSAEDSQFGGNRFDERERRSAQCEFHDKRKESNQNRSDVRTMNGDAPGNEKRNSNAGIVEEFEARCPFDER